MTGPILIPIGTQSDTRPVYMAGLYAARHTVVTGMTGSGKSVSVMGLCESLVKHGVPVLLTDIKGDMSALSRSTDHTWLDPTVNAPISAVTMGHEVLSLALGLSDIQAAVLSVGQMVADDRGMPWGSLSDIRAVMRWIMENRQSVESEYGLVSPSSVSAILRSLSAMGAAPMIHGSGWDVARLSGVGILDCRAMVADKPRLYGAYMLAMVRDVYRRYPEVGDLRLPRLVIAIDESHLLFDSMSSAMVRDFGQMVRLLRSKGVALILATQSPADIPPSILMQMGNRIQHALRGASPADMTAVRTAAQSMGTTQEAIAALPPGRAIVAVMGANGAPCAPAVVTMRAPSGQLGAVADSDRAVARPIPTAPRQTTQGAPIASDRLVLLVLLAMGAAAMAGLAMAVWWHWSTVWPWLAGAALWLSRRR